MNAELKSIKTVIYYTLTAQLVGFLAISSNPVWSLFLVPSILLVKKLSYNTFHNWKTLSKLLTTTFIFGLINGYTLQSLVIYFNQQPEFSSEIQSSKLVYIPTFQIYLSLMTVYHLFQMYFVNCFHHFTLCWSSFLIYHSPSYTIANVCILLQHCIARYFFGFSYKFYHQLMLPSLVIAIIGQSLRITALFTCRSNFTHNVKYQKRHNHKLVTDGVYSFFRHPSYTGYFYFVIFGQLFIGNFVTASISFGVLVKFFSERIQGEEQALARFFADYPEYRSKTYILIPFVKDPDLLLDQENQQS